MSDQYNITSQYIITYLRDIERKLQRTEHSQYPLPHYIGGEIPVEALNNEAKKIMNFVGLYSFTPDCCWEELNNNMAGYIELDGSRSGTIKIHLSSRYRSNGNATIAILAHEICHKLLEFYGLYFPQLNQLNEIYTDLCTIYVGFTQLIVNGYKTTVGNVTFSLGYLSRDTFEQTISIMELVQGHRGFDQQWAEGLDVYSQLARWIINPDKRKCHVDGFAKRQLEYAGLNKRVSILNRLLNDILTSYNPMIKDLDRVYFLENPSYGKEDSVKKLPITSFCLSHPELFRQSDIKNVQEAGQLSRRLDRIIRDLVSYSGIENYEFHSGVHACPFCRNEFKIAEKGQKQKWRVVKCGKCGNKFAIDLTGYKLLQTEIVQPQTVVVSRQSKNSGQSKKWWQFWK